MRVQVAHPAEHAAIAALPFREPLADWKSPNVHDVLGLHRHVVKLLELGGTSYVVKELPDPLAQREYRLLREIDEVGLPTVDVVAVVTLRQQLPDYGAHLVWREYLLERGTEGG